MKRLSVLMTLLASVAVMLIISLCGCGKPKGLTVKELRIATGSRSGTYFPVGETIARALKEHFSDVHVQVLETDGSVQNMQLLQEGKANLALVQSDIANYAVQGKNMFIRQKILGVSGIAPLFPEVIQIITRRADAIKDLKSLKGKKVAVGTQESGTYYNAQQILAQSGMWDEVNRVNLSPWEAMSSLERRSVDAFFFTTALPNPAISELSSRHEIAPIALPSGMIFNLTNTYPYYFKSQIPPGSYIGATEGVPTLEIHALLVSHQSISEDDLQLITRTLLGATNLDKLKKMHPQLAGLTRDSIRRPMSIPLAEGARKALAE
ncbi:MAG TPA: TAXI family TRAP transporter solute-binding subunit [Candidatus Ozemobacteraceae bacterium]|nr:TAXI family TRAP transporter solute-binding subunit [Candidatus Ozemobacteraceae bacterium]